MDFRHLHPFNLAMLGKQGWRFMTNQDNILSKVFQAKCFPLRNFWMLLLDKIQILFGIVFMLHV